MASFKFSFTVKAPLVNIAQFHHDARALKQLTPPPVIVQIHQVDPLAEDSVARFTMWFGPLPVHWVAVHKNVDPLHGFTDIQQEGPLKYWAHTHTFVPVSQTITRINESIEFEHYPGRRGLLSRALFPKVGLSALFHYRKFVTRRALEN